MIDLNDSAQVLALVGHLERLGFYESQMQQVLREVAASLEQANLEACIGGARSVEFHQGVQTGLRSVRDYLTKLREAAQAVVADKESGDKAEIHLRQMGLGGGSLA